MNIEPVRILNNMKEENNPWLERTTLFGITNLFMHRDFEKFLGAPSSNCHYTCMHMCARVGVMHREPEPKNFLKLRLHLRSCLISYGSGSTSAPVQ